jgi:hypothetical protein
VDEVYATPLSHLTTKVLVDTTGTYRAGKHVNLERKILVSLAIWYSPGVLIGYHLGDWFIPYAAV